MKSQNNEWINDLNHYRFTKVMLYLIVATIFVSVGCFIDTFIQINIVALLNNLCKTSPKVIPAILSLIEIVLSIVVYCEMFLLMRRYLYSKNEQIQYRQEYAPIKAFNAKTISRPIISAYLILIVGQLFISWLSSLTYPIFKTNNQRTLDTLFNHGGTSLWYVVILSLVIAPIMEELNFRFVFLNFLKDKMDKLLCLQNIKHVERNRKILIAILMIISASAFSMIHHPQSYIPFLQYFWMGLCFGYIDLKFNDVRASMILHLLNNLIALLLMSVALI